MGSSPIRATVCCHEHPATLIAPASGDPQPSALVLNEANCYHIRIVDPHPGRGIS